MAKIIIAGGHHYEVVEKIPHGYHVWDIGNQMGSDEYLPLCCPLENAESDLRIDGNKLKAIKLPMSVVQLLRLAARFGINDLNTAREAAEKQISDDKIETYDGEYEKRRKDLAIRAIPHLEKISQTPAG